jgi:hypothetical protein
MLNDRGVFLGALNDWSSGPASVSQLMLFAHMREGQPSGFPQIYFVLILNADWGGWTYAGTFSDQPDSAGIALVNLGTTYQTNGALIIPAELGQDTATGSYLFEMAEVVFASGYDRFNGVTTLGSNQTIPIGAGLTWQMQTDGDFVLAQNRGFGNATSLWRTASDGRSCEVGCEAHLQADGGVLLLQDNIPYWSGYLKAPSKPVDAGLTSATQVNGDTSSTSFTGQEAASH